jgi:hypothetical protein
MDNQLSDAQIAHAIDRVLVSERTARDAVEQCQRECDELLEKARAQRRAILDRAQQRIIALHARCTQTLARRVAGAGTDQRPGAAALLACLSDPTRRQRALERLAAALTTLSPESQDDVPRG